MRVRASPGASWPPELKVVGSIPAGRKIKSPPTEPTLRRVSELPSLPNNWQEYFRKRLWNPDD
jgi:hypothetical protein